MSAITTHVLDTSIGRPAVGLRVVLERRDKNSEWRMLGHGETDEDGRQRTLMDDHTALDAGIYRLVFDTREYFEARGAHTLYPSVIITFEVVEDGTGQTAHYHIPLLLGPFGYTTYRGS